MHLIKFRVSVKVVIAHFKVFRYLNLKWNRLILRLKKFFFREIIIAKNRFINIFNVFITFRSKLTEDFKINIERTVYIDDNWLKQK